MIQLARSIENGCPRMSAGVQPGRMFGKKTVRVSACVRSRSNPLKPETFLRVRGKIPDNFKKPVVW